DVVERMPESEGEIVMCSIDTEVSVVAEGTTLGTVEADDPDCAAAPASGSRRAQVAERAGAVTISTPKISLGLSQAGRLTSGSGFSAGYSITGDVSAAPFLEIGLGTTWRGQVTSYRAGGGMEWDNATSVSVT